MKYDMWIIGYDARVILHRDALNVMDRKASVDSSIWPSVFNQGEYPELSLSERERVGFGTLSLPEYTGVNHPLWQNLQNLKDYLYLHANDISLSYWIVAVTGLVSGVNLKLNPDDWPRFELAVPESISKHWHLLGYDVNGRFDEDNISWIFPCNPKGQKEAPLKWKRLLNAYGLFDFVEDAVEFRKSEDVQTPSDAPHFVRGIWKVS